jgi:hypothetical protein
MYKSVRNEKLTSDLIFNFLYEIHQNHHHYSHINFLATLIFLPTKSNKKMKNL